MRQCHDYITVCITVLTVVQSSATTLMHVIKGSGTVYAVTSLGDDVFVMRFKSQQVEVYNAVTFTLRREIKVPGLGSDACGIAACARNECLYVSSYDRDNSNVHRITLSGKTVVNHWFVGSYAAGLSVNRVHHLVVACKGTDKIKEYTTNGTLVREISLQSGVKSPWHAVQLSTGNYVLSQCKLPGVVSVVGIEGQLIRSYGESQTSDVGEMVHPKSLAVTKNDNVLAADESNNRILSINTSTGCVQELALSVDGAIRRPYGLCLDESRSRLYVGEFNEPFRVLVFDGVRM